MCSRRRRGLIHKYFATRDRAANFRPQHANRDRTITRVEFLLEDGNSPNQTLIKTDTTAPYGDFTLDGQTEGTYTVYAVAYDSEGVSSSNGVTYFVKTPLRRFSITGQVTNQSGNGISGLTVTLNGSTVATTKTNLNGYYQFGNLEEGGDFVVAPDSAVYSFEPVNRLYQSLGQNENSANFAATQIGYSISGHLRNASGQPIYPATVNLSGSKTAVAGTDVNGNYFFSNLAPGGNYTVQPYKNQTIFEPPVRTYNNLGAHQTADFTARPAAYTVGGRVADTGGNALAGVVVAMTGTQSATATTGADGSYAFANLVPGGNYTFTPSRSGYNFTPGSRSYANLAGDQTSNFAGTTVTQSVSVQAEDFDDAWDGMAYHDTTPDNLGGQYRASGVDITVCPAGRCSYMIGWNKTGEWLHYTVSIAEPGVYTLALRVANTAEGGSVRVEVDGVDATGAMQISNTGDPFAWTTVAKSGLNLAAGQHAVKVFMLSESTQGWVGNFDSLAFTKEQAAASRVNHALSANGAVATGSSQYNASFPAAAAIDGDRFHLFMGDGRYNMWHSAPGTQKPDVLEVAFSAAKTIDEVVVVTQQDNYANAIDPTDQTTFTQYGIKNFEVQYWNGSAWVTLPDGSVSNNDRVLRRLTFSVVTTTKIRLLVHATADGFSRVWELEAWGQ